jgi:osmotically-inducible protein OsmY
MTPSDRPRAAAPRAAFLITARAALAAAILASVAPAAGDEPAQPPAAAQAPKRNIAGPGDYAVREKLVRLLGRDADLGREKFTLVLVNGGAVFSGEVTTCALKTRALRMAATVRGIINVTDEMRVAPADLSDGDLEKALRSLLRDAATEIGLKDLDVKVRDAAAALSGTVRDYAARIRAEEIAGTVLGVTRVANRLRPAGAPAGQDDASVGRAVVSYLGDFSVFPYPAEIQVGVEGGAVTLSGRVSLFIARQLAANMASLVGGVARVENRIKVDPSLEAMRATVRLEP